MSWAEVRVVVPAIMLALDLGLLIYVTVEGRRTPVSAVYALLALCLAVWALGSLMLENSSTAGDAVVWLRLNVYAVLLLLVSFLLFVVSFLGFQLPRWLFPAYLAVGASLALVTLGTRLVVGSAQAGQNGWLPQAGPLLVPFASLLLLPAYGTVLLIRRYRSTRQVMQRNRIVYVLLGLLGFLVVVACEALSFFSPQTPVPRLLASVFSLLCIAYSVGKARVLDTIVLARRGLVFAVVLFVVGTLYAVGLLLLRHIFSYRLQAVLYVSLGMTLLVLFIVRPFRDPIEWSIMRMLWPTRYDPGLLLQETTRATASLLPPPELTGLVLRRIVETLHSASGLFLVPEGPSGTLRPLARVGLNDGSDAITLRADHPLVLELARNGELLRGPAWAQSGVLQGLWPHERRELEAIKSALLMPLMARGSLVGVIVLGPKSDGKAYSLADEVTLSTLASHISVALDNARLFQDVVEEKERWHTLVGEVMAGVIVTDATWCIEAMNPSASAITGYTSAEAVGKRLTELLGPELGNDLRAQHRSMRKGERAADKEMTIHAKSGPRDILMAVAPLGRGHLLSFSDITHVKEVSRLKSDIVADVSHEFRAPLAAIRAYAELLVEHKDHGEEDTRQRFIAHILHETDRLAALTSDLLDLSKLESGRFERQMEPTDLGTIIHDVMSMLDPQARQRGVAVRIDVPDDLPTVTGDDRLLTMMVRNLVSNAIKYSQESGVVDVAVKAEEGNLVLTVVDRGLGIAEQDLTRIFSKFTRLQAARETGVSGTGLGLAMVKQAADAHGGTITVASRPQAGSRFTVTIPLSGTGGSGQPMLPDTDSQGEEWGEAWHGTSGTGGSMKSAAGCWDSCLEEYIPSGGTPAV